MAVGVRHDSANMTITFKGGAEVAAAAPAAGGPSGVCPQPRKTQQAPAEFLEKANPLPASAEHVQAGKKLFMETARPLACMNCHGAQGNGAGALGAGLIPPPRNFTCGATMRDIPDGQLFWIIKNGSPGTGMMPFSGLPNDEVWQLIQYVRGLAK